MQKQKYICFILSVFLMFSHIGLAVNIHYCKDVIADVAFDYVSESNLNSYHKQDSDVCCGKKKNDKEEPCCKDEVVKQKVDDSKITTNVIQLQVGQFLAPEVYQVVIPESFELQIPKSTFVHFYCESNAPPLYKLFRKLIFYA